MSGLRLAILGSGSAVPDPERGNPSQAVLVDDEVLLFDCGERTTVNLVRAGINPLAVDYLFFTHLHWDHIADFGYFIVTSWNCGRRKAVRIFGPAGTRAMVEASIYGVHATDIEYVRRYVEALPAHVTDQPYRAPSLAVEEIDVGFCLERNGFRLTTGAVEHHQRLGTPSVAYRVDTPYGSVALSGDTAPCESMVALARGADVLVHDCAFLEEIIEARGMWSHSGPVGAGAVAQAAGVGMLVLTHLGPYTSAEPAVEMASMYYGKRRGPEVWDEILAAARSRYQGHVVLGQDGLLLDIGR